MSEPGPATIELASPPPGVVASAVNGLRARAVAAPGLGQERVSLSRGVPLYRIDALAEDADGAGPTKTSSWIFFVAGGDRLALVLIEDGTFAAYREGGWVGHLLATLHRLEQVHESGTLRLLCHQRTEQWAAWLGGERERFWPISARPRTRALTLAALVKEWRIKDERIRLGSSPS